MRRINTNPDAKKKPGKNQPEIFKITLMSNSMYYFIQCAYIIKGKNYYRLVVLQNGKILCDQRYKTFNACKIAFAKRFNHKAWKENIRPVWTPIY